MKQKNKIVLIFDSEDYSGPKSMLLDIGRALQVMNSTEWKSEFEGKKLPRDLVIQINQDL